jgi:hypothetical protein
VADRIYAAVHDVQPLALDAVADRTPAEPGGGELAPRDDAVLALRERGDRRVDRSSPRLSPYDGLKCGLDRHGPSLAPRPSRNSPELRRKRVNIGRMSASQRMRAWGAGVAAGHVALGLVAAAVLGVPGSELFFGLCALTTLALSQLAAPLLRPRGDDGREPPPEPPGDDPSPPWWPEFERAFRAEVRERERERSGAA